VLRGADPGDAVATLDGRTVDAGMFNLFLEAWPGQAFGYRYGRLA
jgi:hypothetical protein